ncbi:ABC transporter permease [Spirochaetia bacterium]|nr:ABC transporter permease [Spirochaetia bacterium]GHV37803.1 ABC transporter permease [Spirochaetia bacterium]
MGFNKTKRELFTALVYFYVILMVFIAIAPFVYVILTALKTQDQVYSRTEIWPSHITFSNFYEVLFHSRFIIYFLNSVFIAMVTTFVCLVLSVMAAYGFTRYCILGNIKIKMAILFTRMFPGILLCIPYYIIMQNLKLIDSRFGLILLYCSFTLPFSIWNICAFFDQVPWELEEAAFIDGCNRIRAFFTVIIHVVKPGLFVTALFSFLSSWDEFMYSLIFISTPEKKTIQVGMRDFIGQYSVDWGRLMAAVVLSLIPVIIFFALVQKRLVTGLSAGAVKG